MPSIKRSWSSLWQCFFFQVHHRMRNEKLEKVTKFGDLWLMNRRPTGTPDFPPSTGGVWTSPRLTRLLLVVRRKTKKGVRKLVKKWSQTISVKFLLRGKNEWEHENETRGHEVTREHEVKIMPKLSSFSRLSNNVSENLHYLGNCCSYSKSENDIRKRIKFPIAILSSDLT